MFRCNVYAPRMRRAALGALIGIAAGVLDVVPMIARGLPWSADVSAFTMWVVVGVLVAVTELKLPGAVHGIVIAFLVLTPSAVLIGAAEPMSLLPISLMTLLLGSAVGLATRRFLRT